MYLCKNCDKYWGAGPHGSPQSTSIWHNVYTTHKSTFYDILDPFYGLAVKTGSIAMQKFFFSSFFLLFFWFAEKSLLCWVNIFFSRFVSIRIQIIRIYVYVYVYVYVYRFVSIRIYLISRATKGARKSEW